MNSFHILLPLEPDNKDDNLIRSGISLASTLKGKLTFLYILNTSQYSGYAGSMTAISLTSLKEQKETMEDHFFKIMKKFEADIPASLVINKVITEGTWIPSIIGYIDKYKPDILLLKHGEHDFIEKILGDSNTEILNNIEIPAWIIPKLGSFTLPKKIAYISDHREGDIKVLKQLSTICIALNATFSLLHVVDEDNFESLIKKDGFNNIISREFKNINIEHLDVKRDKLTVNVQNLIKEQGFELLAVKNESENFLNRFFTRSSVEKLVDSVEIPLAIYS